MRCVKKNYMNEETLNLFLFLLFEILEDKKVNITKSGYCENDLIFVTSEYKHLEYGAILRI